ncbi:hypothetical protein AHF37_01476 [Paragonimus kellicotti]|nr:hypothetical protein AHF37_01476 [Paragonimus kellicotti]
MKHVHFYNTSLSACLSSSANTLRHNLHSFYASYGHSSFGLYTFKSLPVFGLDNVSRLSLAPLLNGRLTKPAWLVTHLSLLSLLCKCVGPDFRFKVPIRPFQIRKTNLNFMEDVNSAFHTVVSKLSSWAISLTNCCWRFLEIHWIKLIALLIVHNAVNELNTTSSFENPRWIGLVKVTNFNHYIMSKLFGRRTLFKKSHQGVVLFTGEQMRSARSDCFSVGLPTGTSVGCLISELVGALALNLVYRFNDNGAKIHLLSALVSTVCDLSKSAFLQQWPMGALMTVCVCWHAIACRQRQFYNDARHERPREGIVFPKVTIDSFDKDLRNVVKFAINYGFYKFGLELCYCVTIVTACLRADAFSVLYLALMLIFLFTPRDVCAKLWLPYLTVLGVLIPIQYASCVGLPPGLCWAYPWLTNSVETDNLLQWLFLPGAHGPPTAKKLTADFFQFVAVALQYQVFKIERGPFNMQYGGGSNKPVLTNTLPGKNERDFVSSKESYLDYLRHLIFYWSYWVSLAIVLATGVTWITLFCLGYMILSFIYLWMGQNVMLRKRVNLIKS